MLLFYVGYKYSGEICFARLNKMYQCIVNYLSCHWRCGVHIWVVAVCLWQRAEGQLLSSSQAVSTGSLSQATMADSAFVFSDTFPQAQLLHQSSSPQGKPIQPIGTACDGLTQDYCAKPGHFYPRSEISYYIEENRSIMKRMFGSVSARSLLKKDEEEAAVDNSDLRRRRQAKQLAQPAVYLCPVEEELVTPFWALNGTGTKLAIVNTPPFEQAIHTVKCARGQPGRCHPTRPCLCTQEYSWFRLLAYDSSDNCKGIFMDWFKFPSHCACKCLQAATIVNAEGGPSASVPPPSIV